MKVIVLLLQPPVCLLSTGEFEHSVNTNNINKTNTYVEHPIDY